MNKDNLKKIELEMLKSLIYECQSKQNFSSAKLLEKEIDNVSKINEYTKKLSKIEPLYENRFLVDFPKYFDIKPYAIKSITPPKYLNGEWLDIVVTFRDFIQIPFETYMNVLYEKNYNIVLNYLDPSGAIIRRGLIEVSHAKSLDSGETLDYESTKISLIKMSFKVKNFDII